jgi:hypothetical protein
MVFGAIPIGLVSSAGLGILATIFAPGPDKALNRLLIWVAIICLYGMWLMVYLSQTNPILTPLDVRYSVVPIPLMQEMADHWNDHNYGPNCEAGQCF